MNLFKLFSCGARPLSAPSRSEKTFNQVIHRSARKTQNLPPPSLYHAHSNMCVGLTDSYTSTRPLGPPKWESSALTSNSCVDGRTYHSSNSEITEILPAAWSSPIDEASTSSSLSLVSRGKGKEIITHSETRLIKELEEAFKFFDANGDGKISACELRDVLRSLGDETTEAEAILMLKEVDVKGDGYIDLEQFIRIHTVRLDSATGDQAASSVDELQAAFQMFDLDNDGYITPEELRQMLKSVSNEECTLDDCSKMIHAFDLDGDGRVNFQEFQSLMA